MQCQGMNVDIYGKQLFVWTVEEDVPGGSLGVSSCSEETDFFVEMWIGTGCPTGGTGDFGCLAGQFANCQPGTGADVSITSTGQKTYYVLVSAPYFTT